MVNGVKSRGKVKQDKSGDLLLVNGKEKVILDAK